MPVIEIRRFYRGADCTLGCLTVGDYRCFTLELPWRDNRANVSCIPAGAYKARKYHSPRHGNVLLFEGVPGRTWIEIHAGNYTRQVRGCILVGEAITHLNDDAVPDVSRSRAALRGLLSGLPDDYVVVDILA